MTRPVDTDTIQFHEVEASDDLDVTWEIQRHAGHERRLGIMQSVEPVLEDAVVAPDEFGLRDEWTTPET